jgi:hypothetical protein
VQGRLRSVAVGFGNASRPVAAGACGLDGGGSTADFRLGKLCLRFEQAFSVPVARQK